MCFIILYVLFWFSLRVFLFLIQVVHHIEECVTLLKAYHPLRMQPVSRRSPQRDPGWAGLYFDLIDHARAGPPAAPPAAATAGPDPLLGLGLGLGLAGRPPGQPWAPRFLSDGVPPRAGAAVVR